MYQKGDNVKIRKENDNEAYDEFREMVLIITHVATNSEQHPGYDEGLSGQGLYDFKTEDGEEVPFSLYDFEIRKVRKERLT